LPLFWTVVILGALIFVHEWGHFLMARLCRVGVKTFSLGFGPKLLGKRIGETEYILSAIPLGGYVKMVGESPDESVSEIEKEIAFLYQPLWKRSLIVLAGPIFNILFALVIFVFLFAILGKPWVLPKIGDVQPASPAALAGLKKGDLVLAVDNDFIKTWDDLAQKIQKSRGEFLTLLIQRGEKRLVIKVKPEIKRLKTLIGDIVEKPVIGIVAAGEVKIARLSPWTAGLEAIKQTWITTKLTIITFKNLILGKISLKFLAGPVGIVELTSHQAKAGLAALFSFAALISINLGIINLFPIPVLDGGHLFLFAIEAIRRRPLSIKTLEITQKIGLAILIALIIMVTYNDVLRLIHKSPLP